MESSRRRSSTVRYLASEQATERAPQNLFLLCVRVAARRVAQREIYVLYCTVATCVISTRSQTDTKSTLTDTRSNSRETDSRKRTDICQATPTDRSP